MNVAKYNVERQVNNEYQILGYSIYPYNFFCDCETLLNYTVSREIRLPRLVLVLCAFISINIQGLSDGIIRFRSPLPFGGKFKISLDGFESKVVSRYLI